MSGEEGENNPALSAAQTDEGTSVEKPKEPENQSSQEDHKADNAAVAPLDNQSEVTDKKPAAERCILTRLCLFTKRTFQHGKEYHTNFEK